MIMERVVIFRLSSKSPAPSSWNIFRTYVFHTHNKFTHLLIHTLTQANMYTYVTLKPQGTIKTSTNLKFEVASGKMEVGSRVILYHSKKFPKWSRKFMKNKDGTISPRENTSLVLGVNSERHIILVKKSDASRALKFSDGNVKADVKRLLESNQPNRRRLLLLSGKKNQAFPKGLSASKSIYHVKKSSTNKFGGRGCQISVTSNATIFSFDGTWSSSVKFKTYHSLQHNRPKRQLCPSCACWSWLVSDVWLRKENVGKHVVDVV